MKRIKLKIKDESKSKSKVIKGLKSKQKKVPPKRSSSKSPVLLIDGLFIANRTKFSATYNLSYKGVHTGLIYGFLNTIKNLAQQFNTNDIHIFWDTPSCKGVRKVFYPEYKNRDKNKTEEELKEKKIFKEKSWELFDLLNDLGFATYIMDGYEADDLLALFCQSNPDEEHVIVTCDEDMYQIISDNVSIYDINKKLLKDYEWFTKTYDIKPHEWVMVKQIGGCKSDTVAGINGIAEKNSIKYINGILNEGLTQHIKDNWDIVERNFQLVSLPHPNLVNNVLNKKRTNIDIDLFLKMCKEMGFKTFVDELHAFKTLM